MLQPKPKFDPNKPFEAVEEKVQGKPAFDPSQPFDVVKKKDASTSTSIGEKSVSEPVNGSLVTQKPKVEKPINPNILREKELTKTFREATSLNVNDENDLNERLKAEENNGGFLGWAENGLKSIVNGATKIMGRMADLAPDEIKEIQLEKRVPFKDEIKKVKQDALKNKEKISSDEVLQRAKKEFLEKEKYNIYVDKANSYLDNLTQKDKKILELDRNNDIKHIGEKNKKILNVQSALKSEFKTKFDDYTDIKNQVESYSAKKQRVPDELIQKGIALEADLKSISDNANKNYAEILKNKEDLGTAEQEFDLFKRENRDWVNFGKTIATGFGDLGQGLVDSGRYIADATGLDDKFPEFKKLGQESSKKSRTLLQQSRDNLRKPVESIESVEGFVNYMNDLVANQAPILAATSTGYGGLAAIGMSSTGQKYAEMNDDVLSGKENYSPSQMAMVPLLYGGAEVVSEIPTLSILKKGGRVISAVENGSKDLIQRSVKQKAIELAKDYGVDMSKELAGEEFTQFTQNMTDKYVLGKDVGLLDGTGKVFKDTFALTSVLKVAPHIAGAIVRPFQTKDNLVQLDENSKKMIEFSKQLENDELSETEKVVIKKQIEKISANSSKIMATTINKMGAMPDELFEEVKALNKKAGEVKAQANEITLDSNLKNKEELLKGLEEEYKLIQAKRQAIINGSTTVLDVLPIDERTKLKEQALEDLVTELNPDGTKNITIDDKQISERANQIYAESKANENTTAQTSSTNSSETATPSAQPIEVKPTTNEEVQNSTTETQQEAQPKAEEQKAEQEVLGQIEKDRKIALETLVFDNGNFRPPNEKETAEINAKYDAELKSLNNEGEAAFNNPADGNIPVGDNVMDEKGNSGQQDIASPEVQGTNDVGNIEGKNAVKPISVGDYNYEFKNNEWVASDKDGNPKPKVKNKGKDIPTKVLDQHADNFDFNQGETAIDNNMVRDYTTWEEDVAEHSKNPIEVVKALMNLRATDATEGLDYKSKAIAEAIGGKSIERSSYTRFGDKNHINASIALQYFAKKGKGSGIDQIAMQAEEAAYGEYNANDPKITEQDVIDFINDNPRGTEAFLSGPKKEKTELLKSAFTELTGLPANEKYISKALAQANEIDFRFNNDEVLYQLSNEDLLSLANEYEQFKQFENAEANKIDGNGTTSNDKQNQGASSEESGVQETRGREAETVEEITDKSTADQILSWLDNAEKNLDDFNKNNVSSIIPFPIAVAKVAIDAMRLAVQAGKIAADVIQAGIDAVKQTQWYQNLTSTEQAEIGVDFLKKISASERQTVNELARSVSDTVSEDQAYDQFRSTAEQSRSELKNKKPIKEFFKNQYRKFVRRFTDRQYLAKRLLDKSELSATKNLVINSHGASGKAKMAFEDAYNKIYKKLTRVERDLLDEIIQAKRFIAIDKNREARGLDPVSHPNFIDKNISQKFLDKLKKEIGDEKFDDLVGRADEYFKVYKNLLQQMFDNGLISKESFDSMSDVDYQPRVFLQFVTDFNGDLESGKKTNNLDTGGLSSDQIKAMSEGDANSLVMNSEWLLTNSLLARAKAMANNNVNKRFMTDEYPKAKKRFDALDPKNLKGDDKRFYKYFKELSSKVIDNPIVGYTESGNEKYQYDKTPANFSKMYYYIDGVQHQFFLENELHESWNDNIGGFLSSDAKQFISYASGSALVKAIATGNNPAFPIVNTPRDFMFTVTFSDQYSKVVPKAMLQVAKDVVKAIKEIKKKDSDIIKQYFNHGGAMDFLSSQGTLKKSSLIGQLIEKSVAPRTKDIAKSVFSKVTLHKISAYSELMFRVGIFQRSIYNQLNELGFKDVSEVTDKQQLEDIYNAAVSSARGILDFNQGGSVTKDLESIMPYINVAFQGGRVAANALEKDPVGTTSRMLQIATMASAVPIGLSLALIGSNKDDDDDKSSYEIYLDAMEGISSYQKMKYMNIVTGIKDDEGQYQVLKIAKAQELSPIMSITDNIYGNLIRKIAGKEKKTAGRITEDALTTFNSNVMLVDLTSPAGFFTRTPIVKATLTYATGYDFFREEPLSMKLEKKPSPTEGMDMNSVEDFYKKLGTEYGLSPVRSKAFVESLITSPNTNPFVGILYGGADAMSSDKDLKQIGGKLFDDIYKSTGKRVVSYTSDFNRQLETNKVLQEKIDKIKLKDAIQKAEFKEVAKEFMNKEISRADLNSKLMELEPIDRKRMINKVKDKMRMQGIDGQILDIKYEQNTESKAVMIMHYYGDIFDGSEDSKKILLQMRRAKGILTPGVKYEYNKLREELKKEKRPD